MALIQAVAWKCEAVQAGVTCGHEWLRKSVDAEPPTWCAKCRSRKWHMTLVPEKSETAVAAEKVEGSGNDLQLSKNFAKTGPEGGRVPIAGLRLDRETDKVVAPADRGIDPEVLARLQKSNEARYGKKSKG